MMSRTWILYRATLTQAQLLAYDRRLLAARVMFAAVPFILRRSRLEQTIGRRVRARDDARERFRDV